MLAGVEVCRTSRALRVLETSHPPGWYLPVQDWLDGSLVEAEGSSLCEWKGIARYFDVTAGGRTARRAAWSYPQPRAAYAALRDTVAVYPAAMDECTVDGEAVRAQEGGFYGGWITDDLVGPFKGAPGTSGW